ncbi:MAG: anti-sigma factor [Thermoleophilia bacterium]
MNGAEHEAVHDLVAIVALGAASPDETARVEAHAAVCVVCAEELATLRATADRLAVAVPQREPPPRLKASLMATVRAEAGVTEPAAAPVAAPRRRWRLPTLGMAPRPRMVFAVLAVALIASLAGNLTSALRHSGTSSPRTVVTAMNGTDALPGATGRVTYLPGQHAAVVELAGLPRLAAGQAYQLWALRPNAAPVSVALLRTAGAAGSATVGDLQGVTQLAITAQPATHRAKPEGPIMAQAALGTS